VRDLSMARRQSVCVFAWRTRRERTG
jgi:hypothetical protein